MALSNQSEDLLLCMLTASQPQHLAAIIILSFQQLWEAAAGSAYQCYKDWEGGSLGLRLSVSTVASVKGFGSMISGTIVLKS